MLSDPDADLVVPGLCLLVSPEARREAEAFTVVCQDAMWRLSFACV